MCNRPVLDKDGEPSGEYVYDSQVANNALKLLGEHLRMFPNKYNITQDNRTFNVNGERGGPDVITLADLRKRVFEESPTTQQLTFQASRWIHIGSIAWLRRSV